MFPTDFVTLISTYLNLDSCNDRVSASVNMVREHLELAGEDCNLRELLLLPLHNVCLVLRKPGGGGETVKMPITLTKHLSKRW